MAQSSLDAELGQSAGSAIIDPAEAPECVERVNVLEFSVLYLVLCLLIMAGAALCYGAQHTYPDFAIYGMCLASVVWQLVSVWSWHKVTGRFFDCYMVLATALWMFNGGGIAVAQVIMPDPDGLFSDFRIPTFRGFSDESVAQAFVLVLACLCGMHTGALLAASRASSSRNPRQDAERAPQLQWIGWTLVALSAVPAAMMLWVNIGLVQESGYLALYRGEDTQEIPWYLILASGLVPGALYLMGSNLDDIVLRYCGWSIIGAFSLGCLALGTRAMFFQNALTLFWIWHYGVRPISKKTWTVLICTGLLFSTVVYWARAHSGHSLISLDSILEASEDTAKDLTQPLNEIGATLITVVYVMDLVPSERPFCWGTTYYDSLWSIFPSTIVGDLRVNRQTDGVWLIEEVNTNMAVNHGGIGFSSIAEAYMNVGVGSPLLVGLFGFILGSFACWSHARQRSSRLAFAGCVISIMLFGARASSLAFTRRLFLLCVIPYIVLWLFATIDSNRRYARSSVGR